MKHAFLITAYKDGQQLSYLITQLLKYNSSIYIHIDKKSTALLHEIKAKYPDSARVKIIAKPVNVYWGGFSHLNAILLLLKVAYADGNNLRFHLLSGQDLPIKSIGEFNSFFETNAEKEYITCFKLPDAQWRNGGLDRIEQFHLNDLFNPKNYLYPRLNGRFVRFQQWLGIKRKKPDYISNYYGGGTWWSLSRNAIDEIMDFLKKHPDYTRHFKNTYCGEELFFQTILSNSHLQGNIMPEDLRYIDWNVPSGTFPPVLDESYLNKITKTQKVFARKFDSNVSKELRNRIEEMVDAD